MFQKATKTQSRLRLALCGPAGAGKTYTALTVGTALGRVAVLDTERGSASKYADRFEFDVVELDDYHPDDYRKVIKAAEAAGTLAAAARGSARHLGCRSRCRGCRRSMAVARHPAAAACSHL